MFGKISSLFLHVRGVGSTSEVGKSNMASSSVKVGDGEMVNGVKSKASKLCSAIGRGVVKVVAMPFVGIALAVVALGGLYAKATGGYNPVFRHENKQPVPAFRSENTFAVRVDTAKLSKVD